MLHGMFQPDRFGPIQVPVRVPDIALTDRGDGTVWALQNDGLDRIKIVSPLPSGFHGLIYSAFEGPRIETPFGSAELIVRDGFLGYEVRDDITGTPPAFAPDKTRARTDRDTVFKIIAPSVMVRGGALAYETEPF